MTGYPEVDLCPVCEFDGGMVMTVNHDLEWTEYQCLRCGSKLTVPKEALQVIE